MKKYMKYALGIIIMSGMQSGFAMEHTAPPQVRITAQRSGALDLSTHNGLQEAVTPLASSNGTPQGFARAMQILQSPASRVQIAGHNSPSHLNSNLVNQVATPITELVNKWLALSVSSSPIGSGAATPLKSHSIGESPIMGSPTPHFLQPTLVIDGKDNVRTDGSIEKKAKLMVSAYFSSDIVTDDTVRVEGIVKWTVNPSERRAKIDSVEIDCDHDDIVAAELEQKLVQFVIKESIDAGYNVTE